MRFRYGTVSAAAACCLIFLPLSARCQTAPGNLSFLLPKATASDVELSGHSSGSRDAYSVSVLAVGGLVASDDKGIYRTVQGPNGRDATTMRVANDVTKLGDLTYVAPALGALYITGNRS